MLESKGILALAPNVFVERADYEDADTLRGIDAEESACFAKLPDVSVTMTESFC